MSDAFGLLGPMGPDAWHRFRGRTVGSIVLTGFGAYSMYWWTVAAIQTRRQAWFYAIVAIAAILLFWAITQLVLLRRAPKLASDKHYRRFYAIRFGGILVVEVTAIILGGPVLGHFQRQDLIGQWINLIVGIHFLPLGKLFKLPIYYATAVIITLSSLGSLWTAPSPLRNAINSGGTALALWITSFIILNKNPSYLPPKTLPAVSPAL
jgi:hypothetical protein